jgi:oligopeptide transport system ATP-binding protein
MAELPLVAAHDLTKSFPTYGGMLFRRQVSSVQVVDRVNFQINRAETLALVGESGCGKSTTGRLLMRMIEPTSGEVHFDQVDMMSLGPAELHRTRRRMQLMFQDPSSAFNPRMSAEAIISEPMLLAGYTASDRKGRVRELLPLVGLAKYHADRFPHQFSGGQRQRIGIARALALRPDFIVCDEPVSALDVSVQAQVINLLRDLQQEFGIAYLFISHDLRVVRYIADRIAVMYLGRLVEIATKHTLFQSPQHPYTRMLLSSVPLTRPGLYKRATKIVGDTGDSRMPQRGCLFANRCVHVMPVCRSSSPQLRKVFGAHFVACHLQSGEQGVS